MTAQEVADLLQVPLQHVYHMSHEGTIPKIKLSRRRIRFRRADIERWLNKKTVKPIPERSGK